MYDDDDGRKTSYDRFMKRSPWQNCWMMSPIREAEWWERLATNSIASGLWGGRNKQHKTKIVAAFMKISCGLFEDWQMMKINFLSACL